MSKGIEIIKDRLQRKRKQYIRQEEKMEQISDTYREPRVIPNAKVGDVFAYLCRVYEFLQHRLKLHFKYELACEIKVGHILPDGSI